MYKELQHLHKNIYKRIVDRIKGKPRIFLLEDKYPVQEAFKYKGETYWFFPDMFKMPTGRALTALAFYEELRMRCTREYLLDHIRAIEIILNDPKKINITTIALIHNNLKDRVELIPMPDFIYKLASVMFMDETESPYSYDFQHGLKKIEKWKKSGEVLDFFLQTPLQELIPSLNLPKDNSHIYFQVAEQLMAKQQQDISQVLSKTP